MTPTEWLKKYFQASVEQGAGEWANNLEDQELGKGIFISTIDPNFRVFEKGVTSGGKTNVTIRFEELTAVNLLDLASSMKAKKNPDKPVKFSVHTNNQQIHLEVPLEVYTSLGSILNTLLTWRK